MFEYIKNWNKRRKFNKFLKKINPLLKQIQEIQEKAMQVREYEKGGLVPPKGALVGPVNQGMITPNEDLAKKIKESNKDVKIFINNKEVKG